MVSTTEVAVQTDEISWAAQKEGSGKKTGGKRERQGCCSLKRFSLMVALVAVMIGVYKKVSRRTASRRAVHSTPA